MMNLRERILKKLEKEGFNARGVKDKTGPYKGSYQRSISNKIGKRRVAGEPCPVSGEKDLTNDKKRPQRRLPRKSIDRKMERK